MAIKLLKKKNYLAMIKNSAKSPTSMFRNLYAEIDGEEKDILDNGRLSCAVFVTSILFLHRLIGDMSATVESAHKKLISFGWKEVHQLHPGAVIVWEKKDFGDGQLHAHIGFYMGNNMAVSNSSFGEGVPIIHHYTYNETRKIEKILWHSELD